MIPKEAADRLRTKLTVFNYKFHDLGDTIVVALPLACSIRVSGENDTINLSPRTGLLSMSRKWETRLDVLAIFAIAIAAGLDLLSSSTLFMFLFIWNRRLLTIDMSICPD